jgi:hypothetical protein
MSQEPIRNTKLYIEPFKEDDSRTPFSADTMNQIVNSVNRINHIECTPDSGLSVTISDYNILFSLSGSTQSGSGGTTIISSGSGAVNFTGQWSATYGIYPLNAITIRQTTTEQTNGDSGTYICILPHTSSAGTAPPSDTTITNTYWNTFAKGHFDTLRIAAGLTTNYTDINKGELFNQYYNASLSHTVKADNTATVGFGGATLNFKATGSTAVTANIQSAGSFDITLGGSSKKVQIENTQWAGVDAVDRTLKIQKVLVCNGGTTQMMTIIGSDPY